MFAFAALAMVRCPAQGSASVAMRPDKITVCCAVQALLRPYLNSKFEIVDVGRSQKTGITFGSQLPHAQRQHLPPLAVPVAQDARLQCIRCCPLHCVSMQRLQRNTCWAKAIARSHRQHVLC